MVPSPTIVNVPPIRLWTYATPWVASLPVYVDKKILLYAPTWRDNSYVASGYTFELQANFKKWKEVLPPEHTLRIPEEKAIVDLMLGVLAIQKQELDVYALDMKNRGQTQGRIEGVTNSLQELSDTMALSTNVSANLPSEMKLSLKNKGKRI